MKAISIRAPWAYLILLGFKPVENRSWPSKYRGPLLIHVSKRYDIEGEKFLEERKDFQDDMNKYFMFANRIVLSGLPHMGVIAGQVNMVDCVTAHQSPYFFGDYGHVYERPEIFKAPIPYKGKLGIFDVPDSILKV